jgi:hypothetical protein
MREVKAEAMRRGERECDNNDMKGKAWKPLMHSTRSISLTSKVSSSS